MIKVYQTIVDRGHGNCMQAVIASLLEKPLEEVPHFLEQESWFSPLRSFVMNNDCDYDGMIHNKYYTQLWQTKFDCFKKPKYHRPSLMSSKRLYREEGVNEYFYASVLSPNYFSWGEKIMLNMQ